MKIILQYSIIAITILRFVFSGTLIAQSSITGIVKAGPEGTPLIGVIVTIKETSSTTTTGSLGEYTFGVATGITITLEVSGYTSSARTIVVGPGVNTVDFWFNAVSDFDGNSYKAIVIGTQVWLGENLKAVHLNDGTNIPNVTDDTEWHNLTSPGLCWYNNDLSNSSIYGALYNWYTVGTGKLCPNGWHVFTAPDWATLETYLGGGTVAGGKLKEAGIVHWSDPNTGATNVSGFSGLPGGMRDLQNGNIFEEIGQRAFWWSSTEKPSDIGGEPAVYYRGAGYSFAFTDNSLVQGIKMCGQSVRCIRDLDASIKAPIVNTSYILNISTNAAEGGGDVTSDGGSLVTSRGICWGTNSNPTTSDYHTSDGNGTGSFTSSLTGLLTNTRYYVRAYATNGVGTTYGNQQYFTTTGVSGPIIFNSNLTYGSVTDIDNNTYLTIQIGSQLWMAENLKVTRFRDGTNISYVTDGNAWGSLITPGYCWHSNDVANSAIYGALYNWYGANTGNLCPVSWHVPTDAEWATLTNYLGGENVAGGKLKETGTTHWVGPNMGATNETGFTALPGGYRNNYGTCSYIGINGHWWSSSEGSTTYAWYSYMYYNYTNVYRDFYYGKYYGFSVRCVRDF